MEQKPCPYCGQLVIAEDGVDPRRRCQCADAVRYSAEQETLEDMQDAVEELFGANCNMESPVFIPVSESELAVLKNVATLVAAELFAKASITLADGSVCTIKLGDVKRKVTVKK